MFGIISKYKLSSFRKKWMKEHPDTIPMNLFCPRLVSVGKRSYGELRVVSFNNKTSLQIGNYVSIAQQVTFLLDVEHNTNTVSSYPFITKILNPIINEASSKGDIYIGDDVWIGYGSTILSGVKIEQGAIIAAGAVVVSDVPAYSIVGGVPAKVIKKRFSDEIIEYLKTLDYGKLTDDDIRNHRVSLYTPIENESLDDVKTRYDWFPKK